MTAAARELSRGYAGVKAVSAPVPVDFMVQDNPIGGRTKRFFDVALVILAGPLLIPVFLIITLAVILSSRGPVLFAHERIGFHGRTFRCLKFRTMVQNSAEVLEDYLAANPMARQEWDTAQKLQRDPRVTRVGRILRALSLDELPQLLNVLRGEMSLVGPRPVIQAELERYRASIVYYVSARPGLTGLWQVSGRSNLSYNQRVRLDRSYVAGWTLISDLRILLRTVPAVLAARGSY